MDPVCKRIPAVYQALDIAKAIVNEKGRGGDECVNPSVLIFERKFGFKKEN